MAGSEGFGFSTASNPLASIVGQVRVATPIVIAPLSSHLSADGRPARPPRRLDNFLAEN
jgi:hypothetical protein